jgi:hypothetical protein
MGISSDHTYLLVLILGYADAVTPASSCVCACCAGAGGMRPADGEQTPAKGTPDPAAAATSEEHVIYDEQGNKFQWRWHPEAGTDGSWKLYAAGTDTLVHEQPDDEATAVKGTAPPEVVPVDQSEATVTAKAPAQEQPAPAAEVVHDEL